MRGPLALLVLVSPALVPLALVPVATVAEAHPCVGAHGPPYGPLRYECVGLSERCAGWRHQAYGNDFCVGAALVWCAGVATQYRLNTYERYTCLGVALDRDQRGSYACVGANEHVQAGGASYHRCSGARVPLLP